MNGEMSAAPLVAWGNAWLTGRVGLDEAVDAVEAPSAGRAAGPAPHVLDGAGGDRPLRAALAEMRSDGLCALRLCLPVPGDPLGLVGAAELNTAAIEAREAVLLRFGDRQTGLVPSPDRRGSSYAGVRWTPYPASDNPPEVFPLPDAEHRLNLAIRESTALFHGVDDIAAWSPEVSQALSALRDADRAPVNGLAPGYPQRAHRIAALAERLAAVVRLAGTAQSRGLSSSQMAARAEALRTLDHAVRRARVAAYCSLAG